MEEKRKTDRRAFLLGILSGGAGAALALIIRPRRPGALSVWKRGGAANVSRVKARFYRKGDRLAG